MRLYHCAPFAQAIQPSVAAIGGFDGMHCGHQAIFAQIKSYAKQRGLASSVILFEPQPKEFFAPDAHLPRLQSFAEKYAFLQNQGIDQLICLRFNKALAKFSAKDFVEKTLMQQLQIKALCVGEDFRFGHKQQGDVALLKQYAPQLELLVQQTIQDEKARMSSSRVREALSAGNFAHACQLLGRPYMITGRVIHGEKRGRLMAFPTANIQLNRHGSPLRGVYAVKVYLPDQRCFLGAANIGVRPTVSDANHLSLEVFVLTDEELLLYGQKLTVEFLSKIRDEKKFDSLFY